MLWIMIILFGAMSILFLCGKGSFLIAGYNTASPQQKAKYDEKKLCQVMGVGTLVITLSLLVLQLNENMGQYILVGGIVIGLIIILIGNMTYAKKSQYEWLEEPKYEKKVWYKNTTFYSILFTIVVMVGVGIMLFTGGVNIKFDEQSLTASASMTSSMTLVYADIEDIKYQKNIETGSRTWGVGSFQIQAGNFKNEEFGRYKLYSYTECHDYIVVKTKDEYVVFNAENVEKTKELYERLQQVIQ